MGGAVNGNAGRGYADEVGIGPYVGYDRPAGMSDEEYEVWRASIAACLNADGGWTETPPVNRSDPPPEPNHQTAAQAIVDACEDVDPKPVLRITYPNVPVNEAPAPPKFARQYSIIAASSLNDEYCEFVYFVLGPGEPIPTLTEWGMIIFCVLLFGWMAWVIVRRRRRATIRV